MAEHHAEAEYARLIRTSFPEYFHGQNTPKKAQSVNDLLGHLIETHHKLKHPELYQGGQVSLALHPYQLFLPQNGNQKSKKQANTVSLDPIKHLVEQADTDPTAKQALIQFTKREAQMYADENAARGILENTRFIQYGPRSEAENIRYTYLNYGNLKDVFIYEVILRLKNEHNICLKNASDKASPAFVDIGATFLADAWMWIYHKRTGLRAAYKNICAKTKGFRSEITTY